MTRKNTNLLTAKKKKNNEFYTRYEDIEEELGHYITQFQNKTVLCNCNDLNSNFYKYFKTNFKLLGLKKLIATRYNSNGIGNCVEYTDSKVIAYNLIGDGDFRSDEVIELLKQSDIIVTNPPFSLFRVFVLQLMKYNKQFLIIGNPNDITCKEIFPLIQNNKMWLGVRQNWSFNFYVPKGAKYNKLDLNNNPTINMVSCWFTNLDVVKQHKDIVLRHRYKNNESAYPKYDNYDAIEVSRVANIPKDYDGVMGIPISFMSKYNPEQFEILGITQRGCHDLVPDTKKYDDYWEMKQDGTRTGSTGNKTNENANLRRNDGVHNYFMNSNGDIVQSPYKRIFIRNRKLEKKGID